MIAYIKRFWNKNKDNIVVGLLVLNLIVYFAVDWFIFFEFKGGVLFCNELSLLTRLVPFVGFQTPLLLYWMIWKQVRNSTKDVFTYEK